MATNFPTGVDNFTIPNSPGSTALSSAGTGSRNHVQYHRDLGDAIEAMQAEATLLIHSHNGSTARHGEKLTQANTHESPDTDSGSSALHHTLGTGANQAAPGNHVDLPEFESTHGTVDYRPVGTIYMTVVAGNPTSLFGGTWVQITDVFLIGSGGTFVAGASGGSSSHTHTSSDTGSAGSHSHTVSNTDTSATHTHTSGNTGSTNPSHTHSSASTNASPSGSLSGSGRTAMPASHTHTLPTSGGASHAHSVSTSDAGGAHSHTISGTSSQSDHSHTVSLSTVSHLPPWLAVYTWKRTA